MLFRIKSGAKLAKNSSCLNLSCESNAFQGTVYDIAPRSKHCRLNLSCESNAFQARDCQSILVEIEGVLISLARVMLFRHDYLFIRTYYTFSLNLSCESNAFQVQMQVSVLILIISLNLSCESNAFQVLMLATTRA